MKKILIIIMLFIGIVSVNTNIKAAQIEVATPAELTTAVNSASDGDVIVLKSNFAFADMSITTPAINITIDGNNLEYSTGKIVVNGSGSGSITIKNLSFPGVNNKRAFEINSSAKTILDNIMVDSRNVGDDGGALSMAGNAKLTILNSTFKNNISNAVGYTGGAIASKNFSGEFTVKNTKFLNNKVLALGSVLGGEGGAIYLYQIGASAKINIIDSYFEGNEAVKGATGSNQKLADGGAIAFFNIHNGAQINVTGTTFYKNVAGDDGGAILIQTNNSITGGVELKNNTFFMNEAQSSDSGTPSGGAVQIYANGGAAAGYRSKIDFINNSFVNNVAYKNGGAIAATGYITNISAGKYLNNIFVGNVASSANYNNIIENSSISENLGGNLGYDNGTTSTTTLNDVFGPYAPTLSHTFSNTLAGTSLDAETIPVLVIAPDHVANYTGTPSGSPTYDQSNYLRHTTTPDIGSVEIESIKYNSNGGEWNLPQLTEFDGNIYYEGTNPINNYRVAHYNSVVNTISDTNLTKSGYTFKEWNTQADGLGTSIAVNEQLTLNSQKTLYAIWQIDTPVNHYKITYNGNTQTSGVAPIDSKEYLLNEVATVLDKSSLVKQGYTFIGWNTQQDGSGITYAVNDSITMNNDITLYAVWQIDTPVNHYKITYNGNTQTSGVAPIDSKEYLLNEVATVLDKSSLVKQGYTFIGWNTQQDGKGTSYNANASITMTKNITLYAIWRIDNPPVNHYKITYNGNAQTKGIAPIDNKEYLLNEVAIVLNKASLVKQGYLFNGWNTQRDGKGTSYAAKDNIKMTKNITLYAQWKKESKPIPNTGIDSTMITMLILVSFISLSVYGYQKNKQQTKS